MTDQELLRIEAAIRRAVTSILEREMPIGMAVRAAAVSLLQGDADPAAILEVLFDEAWEPRTFIEVPVRQLPELTDLLDRLEDFAAAQKWL